MGRKRHPFAHLVDRGGEAWLRCLTPTRREKPADNPERLRKEDMTINELADTSRQNWSIDIKELQLIHCRQEFQRVDHWKGYLTLTDDIE